MSIYAGINRSSNANQENKEQQPIETNCSPTDFGIAFFSAADLTNELDY
ncbi:MAG: hypothetical protein LKE20_06180 [Limosilactobacillus oris]|nr:hypothetical protein [Limosilactobacillus oris]MCH3938941.1 hypothetical protein [Limosilactobacillus oris]HJF47305.1 hypothetical protein [Limosilactobacillus oris]